MSDSPVLAFGPRGSWPSPSFPGRLPSRGKGQYYTTRPDGKGRCVVIESSIPAVLEDRARRQPDEVAYTFIDYEVDPAGFAESLTWSQVRQKARVVAEVLSVCGSVGDRAVILAPQGLDYIVAFLGAMQAGFIAVPLSVPMFGTHDERVSAVLADCAPAAILTTSTVINDIVSPVHGLPGPAPAVIEVDALDLDAPLAVGSIDMSPTKTTLLQYTSGSTRRPAGVMVTHRNIIVNLEQMMSDLFGENGKVPPRDTTVVSWLPFYHDLGLQYGIFFPVVAGLHAVITSPMAFLQKPARWMQLLASNSRSFSGAPNFAFELAVDGRPMMTWRASTWGTCSASPAAPNGYTPPPSDVSSTGFPALTSPTPRCGRGTAWPRRRCTWPHQPWGAPR